MIYSFYTSFPEKFYAQWDNFLENHPDRNVFYTKEMINVYEQTPNYMPVIVLAMTPEKDIEGMLVGVVQKEFKGLLGYLSSRCIVFGGPLVKDDDSGILGELLKTYNARMRNSVIYTQVRNLIVGKPSTRNLNNKGFRFHEHLNIHIDLTVNLADFRKNLKSKLRQNVRKAERRGLIFGEIENTRELMIGYEILEEVYSKAGLPLPDYKYFEQVYKEFLAGGKAKFFKAVSNEELVGIRFVLVYNGVVYDWYAGSRQKYYKSYPNDYLPYKIIEWGIKNEQCRMFDFGGAGKPNVPYGVRDHKLKFSNNIVEPGRFEKIHQPLLYKLALLGLRVYKILKK
ncbi:FemAB-related protein, PEP-CTERM system-associated [Salinivirga cyanobacteriivorans]|uniref:FemAB-related protein, PEP-CTERM system-associated n=1 Tax=Salinivirga cyanobacteriivorans TaxID=1307839 RepID=A0A0S2I0A3_9BACT|nr:GNAT family N-acetyltransferase [Salinivirga cyanobacteriivorans]ALO15779.1 FemAB-related protein, PEP-CTERM system-associated [Salinivirga cyanobacteriivorans]